MTSLHAPMRGYGFAGHLMGLAGDVDTSDVAKLFGGEYREFYQYSWSKSEVYAFRFRATGLPSSIDSPSQAYPLVKAYVATMLLGDRNQDIRGICLKPIGPGQYQCEIVVTDAGGIHATALGDAAKAKAMGEWLKQQGIAIQVDQAHFLLLNTDDKAAYQFWFSHPIVWSFASYESAGKQAIEQGYTGAYLEGQGVFLGTAKAVQAQVKPVPQPPIAPPSGGAPGGVGPGGVVQGTITTQIIPGAAPAGSKLSLEGVSDRTKLVVVGAAALGLVLYARGAQKRAAQKAQA